MEDLPAGAAQLAMTVAARHGALAADVLNGPFTHRTLCGSSRGEVLITPGRTAGTGSLRVRSGLFLEEDWMHSWLMIFQNLQGRLHRFGRKKEPASILLDAAGRPVRVPRRSGEERISAAMRNWVEEFADLAQAEAAVPDPEPPISDAATLQHAPA